MPSLQVLYSTTLSEVFQGVVSVVSAVSDPLFAVWSIAAPPRLTRLGDAEETT